jgi:predicted S18 family serine protease
LDETRDIEAKDNRTARLKTNAINLSTKGNFAFEDNKFYSAASYCFGSNVEFNYLALLEDDLTEKGIVENVLELKEEAKEFEDQIENEKRSTITQLESYMVVKERLTEANDFLDLVLETINNTNSSLRNLAYAKERINSARSWATFMDSTGKEFDLNAEVIRNACKTKIAEVEERLQYVQLTLPQNLESAREELDQAYLDLESDNYELCLFRASKAKASVDTVLSVFGIRTSNVDRVVSNKLSIVERNLIEETEKGIFPILGYSYYEYANSLKETDPFSALLYSSYALELSDLDIYFKDLPHTSRKFSLEFDKRLFAVLLLGIIIGIAIANIYSLSRSSTKKH